MKVLLVYGNGDDFTKALASHLVEVGHELVSNRIVHGPEEPSDRQSLDSLARRADVVVFVLDRTHPDVMFALGVAVGARRPVLLVSASTESLPASARGLPYVRRSEDVAEGVFEVDRRLGDLIPSDAVVAAPDFRNAGLAQLVADAAVMEAAPPQIFEAAVANYLTEIFADVRAASRGDAGFDISFEAPNGSSAIVQIKKYRPQSLCSVSAMRELVGTMSDIGVSHGLFITSSNFTTAARELAQRSGVIALTASELLDVGVELPGLLSSGPSTLTTRGSIPREVPATRSSQLLVDSNALRRAAGEFGATVDLIADSVSRLRVRTDPTALWQGAGATAYMEAFAAWNGAADQLLNSLRDMQQLLRQVAEAYEGLDAQTAAALLGT